MTQESPLWKDYEHLELESLFESPSLNGFDEMIKLTNQGKMWKFPIDNEQGKFKKFKYGSFRLLKINMGFI